MGKFEEKKSQFRFQERKVFYLPTFAERVCSMSDQIWCELMGEKKRILCFALEMNIRSSNATAISFYFCNVILEISRIQIF